MEQRIINGIYTGASGRSSLYDLSVPAAWRGALIVFVHGFMGFKDWGAWGLVSDFFVNRGFAFAKFNLSHNGGTIEDALDFPDLEAFAQNTYSKEVEDIACFVQHVTAMIQPKAIFTIGHSRGGGASLLYARNSPPNKVVLWAAISDIGSRFPSGAALDAWEQEGVRVVLNGRLRQYLPQNFSLYEDFQAHESRLHIQQAMESLRIPVLVIHGDQDSSVSIQEGISLATWSGTQLEVIEGGDHVFGAKHPWLLPDLPEHLKIVCEKTAAFLRR